MAREQRPFGTKNLCLRLLLKMEEFFSQLKDFSGNPPADDVKEPEVTDVNTETVIAEVSSTTADAEISLECETSNDASKDSNEMMIVTTEGEAESSQDTSTDSQEQAGAETSAADVLDLQSIFSNVPRGYFDGGNFISIFF